MITVTSILVALAGLTIGSFLNVVIWRLHTQEGFLRGRSYCPKCKHTLQPADLVPIFSWLWLRGRCRYCSKSISWQYPAVELATAAVFVVLYWVYGLSDPFIVFTVFSAFLIVTFVFDLKHYLILDRVMLPAAIIGIIGSLIVGRSPFDILLGGAAGAGFFALQFFASRGRWVGGGDIRLGAVMGLMLGWQLVLLALFISYLIGSLVSVGLLVSGRKKWGSRLPFGTFLSASVIICLLWGGELLRIYLDLIRVSP